MATVSGLGDVQTSWNVFCDQPQLFTIGINEEDWMMILMVFLLSALMVYDGSQGQRLDHDTLWWWLKQNSIVGFSETFRCSSQVYCSSGRLKNKKKLGLSVTFLSQLNVNQELVLRHDAKLYLHHTEYLLVWLNSSQMLLSGPDVSKRRQSGRCCVVAALIWCC